MELFCIARQFWAHTGACVGVWGRVAKVQAGVVGKAAKNTGHMTHYRSDPPGAKFTLSNASVRRSFAVLLPLASCSQCVTKLRVAHLDTPQSHKSILFRGPPLEWADNRTNSSAAHLNKNYH